MIEITISYDPNTGRVRMSHPADPVLTLGVLERAKALYTAKLDKPAPDSGIVGAKEMPKGNGIGRV